MTDTPHQSADSPLREPSSTERLRKLFESGITGLFNAPESVGGRIVGLRYRDEEEAQAALRELVAIFGLQTESRRFSRSNTAPLARSSLALQPRVTPLAERALGVGDTP